MLKLCLHFTVIETSEEKRDHKYKRKSIMQQRGNQPCNREIFSTMSLVYFNANEFPHSDANKKATDKLIIVYGQSQPMRDSQ